MYEEVRVECKKRGNKKGEVSVVDTKQTENRSGVRECVTPTTGPTKEKSPKRKERRNKSRQKKSIQKKLVGLIKFRWILRSVIIVYKRRKFRKYS